MGLLVTALPCSLVQISLFALLRQTTRRWAWPLGALAVFGTVLAGFRTWTDYQLQAPIAEEYVEFLDLLSQQSAQARAYEASYRHHFGRDTVASRHFEQVCATMLRMAESDGATVPERDAAMASGCRKLMTHYAGDALPRD